MITSVMQKFAEDYYNGGAYEAPAPVQYPGSNIDSAGQYAIPMLYGAGMGAAAGGLIDYTMQGNAQQKALEEAQKAYDKNSGKLLGKWRSARDEQRKAKAAVDEYARKNLSKVLNPNNPKEMLYNDQLRLINAQKAHTNALAAQEAKIKELERLVTGAKAGGNQQAIADMLRKQKIETAQHRRLVSGAETELQKARAFAEKEKLQRALLDERFAKAKKMHDVVGKNSFEGIKDLRKNLRAAKAASPSLLRSAGWAGAGGLAGALGAGALLYANNRMNDHDWDN